MPDDVYRELLFNRYKKRSAADITLQQSWDLLEHLKKLGFKAKPTGSDNKSGKPSDPQSRKIRALWITLANGGAVKNPAESALNKYCKKYNVKNNPIKWLKSWV